MGVTPGKLMVMIERALTNKTIRASVSEMRMQCDRAGDRDWSRS